ncbi:MAG: flagellar assembly protein FliW [Desulfobacterales bacterium]|nr:flagellar assembly protein FliW [Desulfobacterales bacterium]MCP4159603.1 flagellar assembly protein FliW [Deltaproteobacteria bacterium]
MRINTKQFGSVDINDELIIHMREGMPGFPDIKSFILLDSEETKPFYSYQSIEDPSLAFIIMDPFLFKPDYKVDTKQLLKKMDWKEDEEITICVIINATHNDPRKMTANLVGPLIINAKKCEAAQMVIYDTDYSYKHAIFNDETDNKKTGT